MNRFVSFFLLLSGTSSLLGQLVAEIPIEGGLIGIRNVSEVDVTPAGVSFTSTNDGLVPIPEDGSTQPFDFILSNTEAEITIGSLDRPTLPAGSCFVLDAGVQANAEIDWIWGEASNVAQPIAHVGEVCAVPEPNGTFGFGFGVFVLLLLRQNRTVLGSSSDKV